MASRDRREGAIRVPLIALSVCKPLRCCPLPLFNSPGAATLGLTSGSSSPGAAGRLSWTAAFFAARFGNACLPSLDTLLSAGLGSPAALTLSGRGCRSAADVVEASCSASAGEGDEECRIFCAAGEGGASFPWEDELRSEALVLSLAIAVVAGAMGADDTATVVSLLAAAARRGNILIDLENMIACSLSEMVEYCSYSALPRLR